MTSNLRPYEDAYDALNQAIAETGRSRKEIASKIYPGRKIETAHSLFSRAMSPENTDVHMTQEMIETIIENSRADDYIFYLCDKYGFERPGRKPAALEAEIRLSLQGMQKQMGELMKKMEKIEKEARTGNDKS
jgi:hypothetical protein